jgi:CRISPR-associated endonuclease/helicase Cas3
MLNFFQSGFYALTGHTPFEWQTRLFQETIAGNWPERCDIPTGLGKTSIMVIWLLALVWKLQHGEATVPRRLVYIVDRRVVVDQATTEAEKLRAKVNDVNASGILLQIRQTLAAACLVDPEGPFVISTLRGQHQDNQRWYHDPTRAAIIVGTVDMIGSRLLFSGYGLGKYPRSLQAGLLAQDTIIVLDEAHLCSSFDTLLSNVREYVKKYPLLRPFKLLFLTATGRKSSGPVFTLNAANENPEAQKRLCSTKTLSFIQTVAPSDKEADQKAAFRKGVIQQVQALAILNQSIVIYVDTVEHLLRLEEELHSFLPKGQILILTGEMRGFERDKFLNSGRLAPFQGGHPQLSHPSILLTTSCGEVGIDLDADHTVCDLVSLERMLQRFGRCNRFGNGTGEIRVVVTENTNYAASLAALKYLPVVVNGHDASPKAVSALLQSGLHSAAFAAVPLTALLDSFVLDDWALTSIPPLSKDRAGVYQPDYLRPLVSFLLRGLAEEKSNQVHCCWRVDLEYAVDGEDAMQMARALPIKPQEVANIAVYRMQRLLLAISKANVNHPALNRIVAQLPDESWASFTIGELLEKAKPNDPDGLCEWTIYFPAILGGLNGDGLPEYKNGTHGVTDVVDDTTFMRLVATQSGSQMTVQELKAGGPIGPKFTFSSIGNWESRLRKQIPAILEVIELDDQTGVKISGDWTSAAEKIIYGCLKDFKGRFAYSQVDMTLQDHLDSAEGFARQLTRLLPSDLAEAVITATANHDLGKNRLWWQKGVLGNMQYPQRILAKIKNSSNRNVILNDHYRHEFGSVVDLQTKLAPGPLKELVLHLIAAHHGNARPHFEPRQYAKIWKEEETDQKTVEILAEEVRRRYVTLQQQYGWWVLAYLEALVKCSDIQAS